MNSWVRRVRFSLICVLASLAVCASPSQKLSPDYEKKREALKNFEAGVVPLFVLGDVNEDGVVNQEDLRLLRAYIARKDAPGITCLAAADLDDNGSVNEKDVAVLEQVLGKGPVQAPPLSAHSRLGCSFKRFFIAARPQAGAGAILPIHFLDSSLRIEDSSAAIQSGPAKVVKAKDGFIIQVDKDAPANSMITVQMNLNRNQKYFYTFRVAP